MSEENRDVGLSVDMYLLLLAGLEKRLDDSVDLSELKSVVRELLGLLVKFHREDAERI